MHFSKICLTAAVASLLLPRLGFTEILVHFQQPSFVVTQLGQPLDVQILLDADDQTAVAEPLANGLFSYGIRLSFDPATVDVPGSNALVVPAELDFSGFSEGAEKEITAEYVAVAGNVDSSVDPLVPYDEALLASVSLFNRTVPPGQYTLQLELYNKLGPTEQVFIDGQGNVLDDQIRFGSATVIVQAGPGDFNRDGQLTVEDIQALCLEVRSGQNTAEFDLNEDSRVDLQDLESWVVDLKRTWFGDANLDGAFDSTDLIQVFQVGQYEDDVPGNSIWSGGDWNCDAEFNSTDLIVAFQQGGYEQGPRAAVAAAVPEPSSWLLLLPLLLILLKPPIPPIDL